MADKKGDSLIVCLRTGVVDKVRCMGERERDKKGDSLIVCLRTGVVDKVRCMGGTGGR